MMVEGGGWEVFDLCVDVGTEKFLKTIDENPGAIVGLSALLTTTMPITRYSKGLNYVASQSSIPVEMLYGIYINPPARFCRAIRISLSPVAIGIVCFY
jgi:hypothetical protein